MPSSEIYTGMQTGVLDGASTSSGSLVSYRLQEQAKCVTVPGENALWFMQNTKRGDIVKVTDTQGPTLEGVDGLGDWNIPWNVWRAGNAKVG